MGLGMVVLIMSFQLLDDDGDDDDDDDDDDVDDGDGANIIEPRTQSSNTNHSSTCHIPSSPSGCAVETGDR